MVFLKSFCNLSKYGMKNDDLLTPVLSDCKVSDFKSMLSRSLSTKASEESPGPKPAEAKMRSHSFNRQKYPPASSLGARSLSNRRAHSVSFQRAFTTALPARYPFGSPEEGADRRLGPLARPEGEEARADNQPPTLSSQLASAIETSRDFLGLTSFRKPEPVTASSLAEDLFKAAEAAAPATKKHDLLNKDASQDAKADKELWKRLRVGAFAPLGLGVLEGGALSGLSLKASTREKSDMAERRSRVFERLVEKVERLVNVKREKAAELMKKYGEYSLGEVTVSMLFSGLKDVPGMVTETSELDPFKGIRFRGLTVEDLLAKLPGKTPDCPYTEAVLWFLLTGEVPSLVDVDDLSYELYRRSKVPNHVFSVLDSLPRDTHPMTQYVCAVSALQTESLFRKAYAEKSCNKDTWWKVVLEDCLDLVAKNVVLVGYIYRRSFLDPNVTPNQVQYNSSLDYAANLAHFLGNETELFSDTMRLYLALHSDHEGRCRQSAGGNVSAHASHLVGSALADPYFCLASALCGLSGPLHGMANQECLQWLQKMMAALPPGEVTVDAVKKYAEDMMAKRQVIPGYGHAVLKVTDPRHTAFVKFALKHFPEDPMVKVLDTCLKAIPEVLKASGKVRNPNPNVDCSTGVILSHFKVDRPEAFTMFFGLSRSLGILSQLVWARALRSPIERPKSFTLDSVERMCRPPEQESS